MGSGMWEQKWGVNRVLGGGGWFLKSLVPNSDTGTTWSASWRDRQGLSAETAQLEALGIRKRQPDKDCPRAVLPRATPDLVWVSLSEATG